MAWRQDKVTSKINDKSEASGCSGAAMKRTLKIIRVRPCKPVLSLPKDPCPNSLPR
jgi:hypothetical protein